MGIRTNLSCHAHIVTFRVPLSTENGSGSVVGIATGHGLDGPGSNPVGDEIFHTSPDRSWSPPSLVYNRCWVFPGSKELPERDADPLPHSSAVVKKE